MRTAIISKSTSVDEKPTEEMLTYYYKATSDHIKDVRENMRYMAKAYPRMSHDINRRAAAHDRSRFSKDEYIPSVWVEWLKRKLKDKEEITYPSKAMLHKAIAAQIFHNAVNSHHPEYHDDIKNMSTLDIIEFLCDLKATSKQSGIKFSKAVFNILKKYSWSENQKTLIRRLAKLLEYKPSMSKNLTARVIAAVKITITTPGQLEVPENKNVWNMSRRHILGLCTRKGHGRIKKAIMALRVWNKNKRTKSANATRAWANKAIRWIDNDKERLSR